MNNLYDLLNITGNKEDKIKEAITKTKEELNNLTENQTCMIYSSYLSNNLTNNHIVNKIIKTGDFSDYDHHFILVPNDNKTYYLLDLTYSQFKNNEYFEELLTNGYEIVNDSMLMIYLSIVTGKVINQSIDNIYFNKNKSR